MFQFFRFYGLCLVAISTIAWGCDQSQAEHPVHFPWCPPASAPQVSSGIPNAYRVLPSVLQDKHHREEPPVALHPVPTKSTYAYGWFGSNPSATWGRHFGVSKVYTQWTRR
jgi:hypothetical protein